MGKIGNIVVQKALTKRQFEELYKVVNDVFFFSQFIWVINPILGKIPFNLYPYQMKVLWYFITKRFNIVLKFRQAGLTELIAMYSLWLAMYHDNKSIQIISIKDTVAKKVLRKIKYMYKNLPEHLQVRIINGRSGEFGTATDIMFENGSVITSLPTTEQAGRSEALSLLVIDEAAIVRWANTIWASAFPTLSTGGSAIINSTPYGIGNFFHKTWVDACAGGNDFNPIRLRWQMHPERYRFDGDMEWYNTMAKALGPRRTAQEIDGDFLSSGYSVFDLVHIKALEDMLSEYRVIERRMNGQLLIFGRPKKGEKYSMALDIASGRSRDYTALSLTDSKGEDMVVFKGKIPVNKATDLAAELGNTYNRALIAPEANDIGEAVTAGLQTKGYKNLYYSEKIVREKGKRRGKVEKIPGWITTTKNRPIIIDELEKDIREDNIMIKDPFFIQEAYTFVYDERNKPVAMGKNKRGTSSGDIEGEDAQVYHDDAIMAKAINNFVRKGRLSNLILPPK